MAAPSQPTCWYVTSQTYITFAMDVNHTMPFGQLLEPVPDGSSLVTHVLVCDKSETHPNVLELQGT